MIPKRYDKFGTVKILTVSRKQWYKNFENPSKFIFIVHPLVLRDALVSQVETVARYCVLQARGLWLEQGLGLGLGCM